MHHLPLHSPSIIITRYVTRQDSEVDVSHTLPHCILCVCGKGGVSEIESTVKGAKAGEA